MADGTFQIRIGGLKEVRQKLRALDRSLPSKILPAAHRAGAALVLGPARAMAPKGATGMLERSHRVLASQRRGAVKAGRASGRGGAKAARALHEGSPPRYQRTTGRYTGQLTPNRWQDRALQAVGRQRIAGAFETELRRGLREVGLT